jgi:hypothetical protein
VVARADDGGSMHACVGLTLSSRTNDGASLSDLMSYIFYLKKLL